MTPGSTVTLHTDGEMPVIGLGTWLLAHATADAVLHALDIGYRMIDTAVDYGSQRGIGEALARTDVPREEIFLVAKVEEDDDAYEATRRYLDEMQQDYADLVLIHRPPLEGVGEALWEGLVRAREEGFAREIGVSNYSIQQTEWLIEATGEVPVVNQIEWMPFGWDAEMLEVCNRLGIVIQAYSPLTRGERLKDQVLVSLARRYDCTPAQLLLRWALDKGTVPLPKANRWEHQEENLGAFDIELHTEDMERLDGLNEKYSSLGPTLQFL